MKLSRTLTTAPLKATLMAFAFASVSFADPVNYWWIGSGNYPTSDRFVLDDATDVNWEDGNILCAVNAVSYMTPEIQASGKTSGNTGDFAAIAGDPFKAYGIYHCTGLRYLTFNRPLELGAGGFTQGTRMWDWSAFSGNGGIKLTASQTWTLKSGVDWGEWQAMTAEPGTVVTVIPTSNKATGNSAFVWFRCTATDLSNAEMIVRSRRVALAKAGAKIKAKKLSLDVQGTLGVAETRLYVRDTMEPVIDGSFAKEIVFNNGINPELWGCSFSGSYLVPGDRFENVVYGVDKMTVGEGTVTFGDGYSYSIKDAGTQLVEVKEGATVIFRTLPTAGRIKVTGAGTVSVPIGPNDVDYDENFTGQIAFTDVQLVFTDVSNFSGTFILAGSSTVAMPATADWPANFKVRLNDTAKLFLPAGSSADESKILGTKNYSATAVGYVAEPPGTLTVNAGETCSVVGDGLTAATAIVLNGGTLEFTRTATVASPVTVSAASTIAAVLDATGTFKGAFAVNAKLTVNNGVSATATSRDATAWPVGLVVFAGDGEVTVGGVDVNGGAAEFRGSVWNFAVATEFSVTDDGILAKISEGAQVSLADGDMTTSGRVGLSTGNPGRYPGTVFVCSGAVLTVGSYRMIRLGNQSWQGQGYLTIDNATVKVLGGGEFDNGGNANDNLKNTSEDRCPMAVIAIRNGGKLITDRVLSHTTATHHLDSSSFYDDTFEEGVRLVLDGGTYALGPNFGYFKADGVTPVDFPNQHPNLFFSQESIQNVGNNIYLTYTSEITVRVGAKGGTFDLSGARAGNNVFSNTVLGVHIPLSAVQKTRPGFAGMDYNPCRGPRWTINGPLNVKGRGDQELVLNGINPSMLSQVGADGAVVRVTDTNGVTSVALEGVTLGAAGAGVFVETLDGKQRDISVDTLTVAENGVYAATAFNIGSVTVGDVVFGANAALGATVGTAGAAVTLPISGTVTLADSMRFAIGRGVRGGAILSADGGILPAGGDGVTWTPVAGFRKGGILVSDKDVVFRPSGLSIIVR